ncbi:MerR family transcriptional regulator [Psychromonas sp. psych-6C06]|uniref:MerR family transcriptional regulator n=1 Tax=Psychromonas sp. psych-6C06 TaxID=2058089 RepID=UPI000C331D4C|nr:helix-turn-helix domain-containing protein [Psychromonas sp. psych-6C06]PKF62213.1 MerR family transcriptional regulator [Psychromonas sp. psych-6C06]
MAIYSIGQLATKTGCKIPTIRYYEEINILPMAGRSEGNQRRYNEDHLQRLNFVRHCRALGFSLDEIRQLIHLQTCKNHIEHEAHDIAVRHLQDVRQKIKQLQLLADELQSVVQSCCSGEAMQCQILNVLNKPCSGS